MQVDVFDVLDEVQPKHSKLTVYMGQSALAGGVLQECTPTSDVMRLCEPEAQRGANGQPLQRSPDGKPPVANIETKEWQVFLPRERDKKLGLDVDPRQRGHLLVLSIEEGTVQEYNTKNPENAVQEGDHIVSVNGSSQDTEMVRQFRSAPFLLIVFRRTEAKVVEKRKLRLEDLRRRLGESLRISPAVSTLPRFSSLPGLASLPSIASLPSTFAWEGSGHGVQDASPSAVTRLPEANGAH